MNKSKLAIAIALTGMVSTSAFATNGYFSHGYGAKEKGMGGVGVAKAGSSITTANNPANLTQLDDRMDWGVSLFNPNRSYTVEGDPSIPAGVQVIGAAGTTPDPSLNQGFPQCTPPLTAPTCQLPFSTNPGTVDSNKSLFAIPSFGYVNRIDESMVFGFSLYGNGGMNSEYRGNSAPLLNPQTGAIQEFAGTYGGGSVGGRGTAGIDLIQLFLNTSLAFEVNESLSLGASFIIGIQSFEATGLQAFANISSDATKLSNNGHDTAYGYGFKLGANFSPTDSFTFGVSYQSKIYMTEFDKYAGLFADQGDFDVPATYTLGFAWSTSDSSTFLLDYQEIQYSGVKALGNGLSPLFSGQCLDALNNTLLNGVQSAAGPGCLGGSNGIGFGWDDMSVIKLGYEWGSDTNTYRVGYSTTDQPIGSDDVNFNILAPGVIENHFTAGYTNGSGDDEWTVFIMYAPESKVTGTSSFDPNQTITIRMDQLEIGFESKF